MDVGCLFEIVFLYFKLKIIIISKISSFFFFFVKYLEVFGMVNFGCVVNMILLFFGIKLISIENGRIVVNYDM